MINHYYKQAYVFIACGNVDEGHEIRPRTKEGCSEEGIELRFEGRVSKVN